MLDYLLLVDHDLKHPDVESIVKKLDSPFRLIHAATGKEALRTFRFLQPSFVFINFELPDNTGLDWLRQMQPYRRNKKIRFFIFHRTVTEALLSNAKQSGAQDCLEIKSIADYLSREFGTRNPRRLTQ